MRTIIYFLLLLSLSTNAQTKRALVIGLGEQQDKAWNKINGDKDVAFVEGMLVSVSAMLVDTRQKNIAQAFILERYFFVSICSAAIPDTCLSVFLAAVLLLC